MESSPPKPIADMTAAERQAMLSRREIPQKQAGMEIGGTTTARRLVRLASRLLALLTVAGLFVVLFFRFTASWRIALIVVACMLIYMLAIGRMVEGRAERLD